MIDPPSYWKAIGTRLCRYINITTWAEYFSPRFFLMAALGALLLYAFRRIGIDPLWAAVILGLGLVFLVFWTYRQRKNAFFDDRQVFAFIDYQMGMQSTLSAAHEGKSPWPVQRKMENCVRWRSPALFLWVPSGMVLLIAACVLPLPVGNADPGTKWEKPPSIANMEHWVETLQQMKEVEQEDVRQMEQKLQELMQRPEQEMYSHSALEAAASLEEAMKQDITKFAQNLQQLREAMKPGSTDAPDSPDGSKLDPQALKEALNSMKGQNLQLAQDMANQLADGEGQEGNSAPMSLSAEQIMSMSPDQLKELGERFGDIASDIRELGIEGLEELLGECEDCQGKEEGEGMGNGNAQNPGQGAPARGRGDAPLSLGERAPEMDLNRQKLDKNPNAKVTLGEKMGEETGTHTPEEVDSDGPGFSDGVKGASSGGQATWADQYTPAEREALKNYFK